LDCRATKITEKMKIAAAEALAKMVQPEADRILPDITDKQIPKNIAKAVKIAWNSEK